MPGVKGRSGGARAKAGRPQARLFLSKRAAQELKIVVSHKRNINPNIQSEEVVAQLIHEQWQEIDAQYQSNQSKL
jgi:hypothetical protein